MNTIKCLQSKLPEGLFCLLDVEDPLSDGVELASVDERPQHVQHAGVQTHVRQLGRRRKELGPQGRPDGIDQAKITIF